MLLVQIMLKEIALKWKFGKELKYIGKFGKHFLYYGKRKYLPETYEDNCLQS